MQRKCEIGDRRSESESESERGRERNLLNKTAGGRRAKEKDVQGEEGENIRCERAVPG